MHIIKDKSKHFRHLLLSYDDNLFLCAIIFFSFLSLAFIPLKMNFVSSCCHKAVIFTIFLWSFYKLLKCIFQIAFFKTKHSINLKRYIVVLICIAILILTFISIAIDYKNNSNARFTFDYFSKWLLFCATILFMCLLFYSKISKMPLFFLKYSCILLSIVLIALFIFGPAKSWGGLSPWKLLTLNYSNPNAASIVLTILSLLLLYYAFVSGFVIEKVFLSCLFIFLIFLNYLTSCRNGFITIGLSVLLIVLIYFYQKYSKIICLFYIVLPLVVLSLYIFYFTIKANGNYFVEEINAAGKTNASRYIIWINGLNLIKTNPFIGSYYEASSGSGVFHFHNSLLDVAVSYGIIILILTVCFLFLLIKGFIESYVLRKSLLLCIPLGIALGSCCLGIFESFPFYASNGIGLIALFPLLYLKSPFGKSIFDEKFSTDCDIKCDVLIVNNVFSYGSTGKIVEEIHKGLLQDGYGSYVIYGRNEHYTDLKNVVCIESMLEVRLSQIFGKIFHSFNICNFFMTKEIIRAIRHLHPKIVHIHSCNDFYMNFNTLFSYLSSNNIETIYTNHSELLLSKDESLLKQINNEKRFFKKLVYQIQYKLVSRNYEERLKIIRSFSCDKLHITSVSPYICGLSSNSEYFHSFNNHLITNGTTINIKKCDKNFNLNKLCNYDKKALFVTPSLLNPNKGFSFLVELAKLNPNIVFIVLSLDTSSNIVLPPNIIVDKVCDNDSLLSSYYANVDITIILSEHETFSMPVAESLSCGTPVVGFEAGGPESIAVLRFCKFVPYNDLLSLNSELHKMIYFNECKEEISALSMQFYSINKMISQYLDLYKFINPLFGFWSKIEIDI